MTPNDPRRCKSLPDLPVLIKIQTLPRKGEEEEEILAFMPDVPLHSDEKVIDIWNWLHLIPSGYSEAVSLKREYPDLVVSAKIVLPEFDELKARTFADRLEKFIEGEISIIKNGY